jgi:hypothetical protein
MDEVIEELKYIECCLEFSNSISVDIRNYIIANSLVSEYDGVMFLTKQGIKLVDEHFNSSIKKSSDEYVNDQFESLYDEDYGYLDDNDLNLLKGFKYE